MYNKKEVLQKVDMLYSMWKKGSLGGEVMPEDANPHYPIFRFIVQRNRNN